MAEHENLLFYFYLKELAEKQMEEGEKVMVSAIHLNKEQVPFYLGFNS